MSDLYSIRELHDALDDCAAREERGPVDRPSAAEYRQMALNAARSVNRNVRDAAPTIALLSVSMAVEEARL